MFSALFKNKNTVIDKTCLRIFRAYFASSMCKMLMLIVNSAIAGMFIGKEALSAIELMSPILLIDEMLHDCLGSGVSRIMAKKRVKYGKGEANRFIAADLLIVFTIYTVVIGLLILFSDKIVGIFTDDSKLIADTLKYYIPVVSAMPFFELLLCLENACTVDGGHVVFSARITVMLALNIVFDILAVTVFDLGISGLAWSNICSTAIGYTLTLGFFFSKKCSVRPDFSVVKDIRAFRGYFLEIINIGKEYVILETLSIISTCVVEKCVTSVGNSTTLAIWYVVNNASKTMFYLSISIFKALSVAEGVLLGEEDYLGINKLIKKTLAFTVISGAAIGTVYFLFSNIVCRLFGANGQDISTYVTNLRISLPAYPLIAFEYIAVNHLVTIGKEKLSRFAGFAEQIFAIPLVIFGMRYGVTGIIVSFFSVNIISSSIIVIFMVHDRSNISPVEKDNSLLSFYFELIPTEIAESSRKTVDFLRENGYGLHEATAVGLLIEESCVVLSEQNNKKKKNVSVHIRVVSKNGKIIVSMYDNGTPVSVNDYLKNLPDDNSLLISKTILDYLSDSWEYERILEMNFTRLRIADRILEECTRIDCDE